CLRHEHRAVRSHPGHRGIDRAKTGARMMRRHLAEYLEASAAKHPNRIAVVDSTGGTITFDHLNRRAEALAGFLHHRGIKRGDRVGVVLPKSIEAVIALFGIMKAGAAYVPVDYTAPLKRGHRILTDCRIRGVIIDPRCLDMIPGADNGDGDPCLVITVSS